MGLVCSLFIALRILATEPPVKKMLAKEKMGLPKNLLEARNKFQGKG